MDLPPSFDLSDRCPLCGGGGRYPAAMGPTQKDIDDAIRRHESFNTHLGYLCGDSGPELDG